MIRRLERDGVPHNLLAHPLLVVCPPVGRWLHDRTEPVVPTIYGRRQVRHDHPLHDLSQCLRRALTGPLR